MPASTVTEYLAALPADRRDALNEVRRGINRALPPGYKEGIQFGMISWFVPLSTYPAGYGGNPKGTPTLMGSQKKLHGVAHDMFLRAKAGVAGSGSPFNTERAAENCGHGPGAPFQTLPELALDVVGRPWPAPGEK